MAALETVVVSGYKSIAHDEIPLERLNVLIGANGAGKSNFIGLFHLARNIASGTLREHVGQSGGPDALLRFGRKKTRELSLEFRWEKNRYGTTLIPTARNELIHKGEWCSGLGDTWLRQDHYRVPLGTGHAESRLADEAKTGSIARWVLERLRRLTVFHFSDTGFEADLKRKGRIEQNDELQPTAANLAAFLYRLKVDYEETFSRIVETTRQVAPFIDELVLEPDKLSKSVIELRWKERGSTAILNAHALSDGTLRFLCLAAAFLQPALPSTLVLDEPELGLHPFAITVLAALMREASHRTQIVVATQSVSLVNQLDPEELVVVDRTEEGSKFRRLESKDLRRWLKRYALGELWEKNVLHGRPTG